MGYYYIIWVLVQLVYALHISLYRSYFEVELRVPEEIDVFANVMLSGFPLSRNFLRTQILRA